MERGVLKPLFLEMEHPSLVDAPPTGDGWTHEVKWDGHRGQVHLDADRCRMFIRPNKTEDGRLRHPSFEGFRDDLLRNAGGRRRKR